MMVIEANPLQNRGLELPWAGTAGKMNDGVTETSPYRYRKEGAESYILPGMRFESVRPARCTPASARRSWASIAGIVFAACVVRVHAGTSVVAWGAGTFVTKNPSDLYDYGQSMVPNGLTNTTEVAGGWRHTVALENDGTLVAWGDGTLGQTNLPVYATNEIAVACGGLHGLALGTNGMVIPAGDNGYGQIDVPLNLTNAVAVAGGFYHSLALRADGTVSAWGMSTNATDIGTDPNYGQCLVPPDATNVVAISAGGWHSLALRADGSLVGWGRDDSHQRDFPPGLSNVVAIAAGGAHSMALRSDGTVAVWGQNTYMQTNVPAGLSNVVAIAAGGWHCLALKSDGTVVAWGAGTTAVSTNLAYGQSTVPAHLTNAVQIAAGWAHSLALVGSGPPILKVSLTNATVDANGFHALIPTHNGRVYRLEYRTSLADTNWIGLPLRAGTGGLLELSDPDISIAQKYYRVEQW
jgi:hypothetical protein